MIDAIRRAPYLTIFVVALAARLAYVFAMYAALGPEGLYEPDGLAYLHFARTLHDHGFIGVMTAAGDRAPETTFMPFYLAFLAAHMGPAGGLDPFLPVLSQAGLGAATSVIAAALAATVDRKYVWPAGLFAALTPTSIVMAGLVYNDTLFTFLCALALLAILRWLRAPGWGWALVLGVALGLGALTRAMLLPWVLLLLAAAVVLYVRGRGPVAPRALQMAAAALIPLAMLAPVSLDNHARFGSYKLTSQGGPHLLLWVVPLVKEAKDGTPYAEGASRMQDIYHQRAGPADQANRFEKSARMSSVALDQLVELGPVALAKAWMIGSAINVLSPAATAFPPVARLPRTGFYATPADSQLERVWNFMSRNESPLYAALLIVGSLVVLLLRAVQAYGMMLGYRTGGAARLTVLVLVAWGLFVLAVNGPIAAPKYRLPIEPVFAVFFAFAFDDLWRRARARGERLRRARAPA